MCVSAQEFQKVNPTTQIALFSSCVNQCSTAKSISWNIYHGKINSSAWILFNQIDQYENSWFYGRNTSHFTATHDLFLRFPNITHWRFEVIYQFETISSLSALHFEINPTPANGSCQINPKIGITNTLFNVNCSNWQIKEKIKEYSLYTTSRQIIAFSPVSSFQVRLPVGKYLNLVIRIRDILNGITEFNLSSVTVTSKPINLSEQSFVELLSSGNQNIIGQVLTLVNDEFDRIYNQIIEKTRLPLISISISSLGDPMNHFNHSSTNETARFEFIREINHLANLREYYIQFINDNHFSR